MTYRPYPNRERALRQLARKERVTHRVITMPDGSVDETHVFPGQSLAAWLAYLQSDEHRAKMRRIGQAVGEALASGRRPA